MLSLTSKDLKVRAALAAANGAASVGGFMLMSQIKDRRTRKTVAKVAVAGGAALMVGNAVMTGMSRRPDALRYEVLSLASSGLLIGGAATLLLEKVTEAL